MPRHLGRRKTFLSPLATDVGGLFRATRLSAMEFPLPTGAVTLLDEGYAGEASRSVERERDP